MSMLIDDTQVELARIKYPSADAEHLSILLVHMGTGRSQQFVVWTVNELHGASGRFGGACFPVLSYMTNPRVDAFDILSEEAQDRVVKAARNEAYAELHHRLGTSILTNDGTLKER